MDAQINVPNPRTSWIHNAIFNYIYQEMRDLLADCGQDIRSVLEMRLALLLLIQEWREIICFLPYKREDWLEAIERAIRYQEQGDTVRSRTGRIISSYLSAAPWGAEKPLLQSSCNTVETLNCIFAAMTLSARFVNHQLEQAAREGVDLQKFDVEEDDSDEYDDGEDDGSNSQTHTTPLPRLRSRLWTAAEKIALLETWRDHQYKTDLEKTRIFNERIMPPPLRLSQRTFYSISLQLSKLVKRRGLGLAGRVLEKLAELKEEEL